MRVPHHPGRLSLPGAAWLLAALLIPALLTPPVALAGPEARPAAAEGEEDSDPDEKKEEQEAAFEETVVVTASRADQNLLEAPASVSVITASDVEASGADNYGELLRRVPSMNVVQFGARDVQITGRAATSSLATGNLVLVDGRSIYQDFFGFVLWDFVPTDFSELDQIEVVRGPGSSVWGANAFTGVVNIRTKKPQEMDGTVVKIGGGEQASRDFSIVHADANDAGNMGWKLSASWYEQNPWPRRPRTLQNGGQITPLPDDGTEQPKLDFRLNRDLGNSSEWDFGIGGSRTSGLIHTGIGPFDIDNSSGFYYTRFQYKRKQFQATGYVNILDGDALALLTRDTSGQPLAFGFDTNTLDLSATNGHLLGTRQRLVYGVNVRRAEHDLTIAPQADQRDEAGLFIEDEIHMGDHFRLFLGARVDDVEDVNTVFSPRISLLFPVSPRHTFRLSANRAFRAPSLVNQFLDVTILQQANLTPVGGPSSYIFPVQAKGNPDIEEEIVTAVDAAYNHAWAGGRMEVSVYRNRTEDLIDFRPVAFYSSSNPPPGWPLPLVVLDLLAAAGSPLPAQFTYVNVGRVRDVGAELYLEKRLNRLASFYGTYSFANAPIVRDDDALFAINIPAKHKVAAGLTFGGSRNTGSVEASYTDRVFWSDVLDSRFFGTTSSYFLVNGRFSRRLNDVVTFSVAASNLMDNDTPRHIFGDNVGRRVSGELRFRF